jgi:hypothetical protein
MLIFKVLSKQLLLGFTILFPSIFFSSHAAVINYDESVDGDISSKTFLLDSTGDNIFSGTVAFTSSAPYRDDENFDINLATGVEITGYSISFSNRTISGLSDIGYYNMFNNKYYSHIQSWTRWTYLGGANPIRTFQPPYNKDTVGDFYGDYLSMQIAYDDQTAFLTGPTYTSLVDWDIVITTTAPAVPVPAAVWLFGSGLLGLVGVARRKRQA